MKQKREKRINFYQGHICVKNEDGSFSFVSDACIPKIKQRIDIHIESNSQQFSVKDIIFTVVKEYFKIPKTFVTPNHTSATPLNDPLYMELSKYVAKNALYKKRLEKRIELHRQSKESEGWKRKRCDFMLMSYEKNKRQRLKRIVGKD